VSSEEVLSCTEAFFRLISGTAATCLVTIDGVKIVQANFSRAR